MKELRKYEINYKTVAFIEKAIAYTFETPRSEEEKKFMERNKQLVQKYVKRYPRINYDPFGAYQYGCSLFSSYSAQEKEFIWSTNSDMAIDNTNITWLLLNQEAEESVGIYFIKHFFYRIKILFQQIDFFLSTRFNLIIYSLKNLKKSDNI